ncbi:MAG: hypothetical protein QXH81_10065 [Thermofilaceae archaeon]
MEIGNEMNKQAAAPAGAGAAAMRVDAPAAAGTPPAGGAKQGAVVRGRVERLVIVMRGSDGDEWIAAGEETIVFACPGCGSVFTVERDGTVTVFLSIDDLIQDLIAEWNLLLEDEGVRVVEVRVERW